MATSYLPDTGVLRKDPLECEFGDAILESEWEHKLVAFDWLPGQFVHTLYDPVEPDPADLELYGHLHFHPAWPMIDGVKTKVYRRIDMDAFQKHMEEEYAKGSE